VGFGETTSPVIEAIATAVVDAAYKIHTRFGPGLLESAYRVCLAHDLRLRGFDVQHEVPIPLEYEGVRLDCGFRIALLVGGLVIVEVKAVAELHPVHEAQVITYLKLTGKRLGILINFNKKFIKDGIKRIVH
jgi:GxxExxY protein